LTICVKLAYVINVHDIINVYAYSTSYIVNVVTIVCVADREFTYLLVDMFCYEQKVFLTYFRKRARHFVFVFCFD